MAREAEAAGRDREAAHYRDNLAILRASKVVPEPTGPAKPCLERRRDRNPLPKRSSPRLRRSGIKCSRQT